MDHIRLQSIDQDNISRKKKERQYLNLIQGIPHDQTFWCSGILIGLKKKLYNLFTMCLRSLIDKKEGGGIAHWKDDLNSCLILRSVWGWLDLVLQVVSNLRPVVFFTFAYDSFRTRALQPLKQWPPTLLALWIGGGSSDGEKKDGSVLHGLACSPTACATRFPTGYGPIPKVVDSSLKHLQLS